jgi:hypothetical protein
MIAVEPAMIGVTAFSGLAHFDHEDAPAKGRLSSH